MLLKHIDHHLAESDGDKGHRLGTLPNDLIATNQGKSSVPSHDSDGEVESRDDSNVADGVPDFHHEVAWSLRVEDFTIDGSGHADSHVADVNEFLDFSEALRPDLTHLESDESTKSVFLLPQSITNLAYDLASHGRWGRLPAVPFFRHCLDALLVVCDGGALSHGNFLVVVWVDRGLFFAASDPFAASVASEVHFGETQFGEEWILAVRQA